ncbi:MAG: hypothetical protein ACYCOU_04145 [Sulfobacillus sp.]
MTEIFLSSVSAKNPPASEVPFRRLLSSLARRCLLNDTCAPDFAYIGKVVCDYEVPSFVPRPDLGSIGQRFVDDYYHSLEHCDPEELAAGMRAVEALDRGNEAELDKWSFERWAESPPEIELQLRQGCVLS